MSRRLGEDLQADHPGQRPSPALPSLIPNSESRDKDTMHEHRGMFQVPELASVVALNDEQQVRSAALETDFLSTDVKTSTLRVAKVLLLRDPRWDILEIDFPNKTGTPVERWIERLKAEGKKYRAVALSNWCAAPRSELSMYALFLYNLGYGNSRKVIEYLLHGEKGVPPYLKLLILNILRQSVGLSHDELHRLTAGPFEDLAPWINRIFRDDAVFDWFGRKKLPIRFYGGVTYTIIGMYDQFFQEPGTGTRFFDTSADMRIDLGGGFNTSEIERLTGCSFMSADLVTPRLQDSDEDLIIMDRRHGRRVAADASSRKTFLERQDRIRHMPFDVFQDRFPLDAESYSVFSSGFMTSTLRPSPSESSEVRAARLGATSTSVHAILRVVELAAAGKKVDLFTISRATSRAYKYKTCLMQWREGRLARLQTTDWSRVWDAGWDEVYGQIGPGNPRFLRLAH
jgi:hypothetical protein